MTIPSMYERVLAAQGKRGTPEGEAAYGELIAELLKQERDAPNHR